MNIGINGSISVSVIANMLLMSTLPRINNVDAQDSFQLINATAVHSTDFTLLIAAIEGQGNDGKHFYLLTETFSSKVKTKEA